ncbi:hypothetical protein IL54_1012 [Sphingobium sp. ba1]|nr:hypothetical protein IL54_1012 [Sphingobium sp. ba1]
MTNRPGIGKEARFDKPAATR